MPHSFESTSATANVANDQDEAYTRFDKARFDQCLLELQNILNKELRGSSKTSSSSVGQSGRDRKKGEGDNSSSDENCYHFVAAPKKNASEPTQRSKSFITAGQMASPKAGDVNVRSKSVKKWTDSIYNNACDDDDP